LTGALDAFLNNHNHITTNFNNSNFINTNLWKQKSLSHGNKLVIPYFLYFDDFEINNALGSHSSSIVGVYYSFPIAPHYLRSNLNNIFIAAIFNTKDVKFIGNERIFYQLIKNINGLDNNGLELNINGKKVNVYLSLGLILGDNLGLNAVLGFSRSFSSDRFCLNSKNGTNFLANENVDSLRTKQNYE
jgi:hypothetical protein